MADIDAGLRHRLNNLLARMLAAAEAGLSSPRDGEVREELQTIIDLIEAVAAALRPLSRDPAHE
ncbi:MAG TPA: hypothetical protein VF495_02650 [Phenylobacterium sp.]|jgi:hypothetical protein